MKANKLAVIVLVLLTIELVQCSKDYETPVEFHKNLLSTPTDPKVDRVGKDGISLRWNMSDVRNVDRYLVSVSDSTSLLYERFVSKDSTIYSERSALFDSTVVDSAFYYFQVRAVDANLFQGPKSMVDTLFIP